MIDILRRFKFRLMKLFWFPGFKKFEYGSYIHRPWWVYNPHLIEIGERFVMGRYCVLNAIESDVVDSIDPKIKIGKDVYFGSNAHLHAIEKIKIGDGCVFSENVYISDVAHGLDPNAGLIMKQPLIAKGSIEIGDHTFVGLGVSIMPGVRLGHHCVVGTRSVVTHSFDDYSMIAGSPARLIKIFDVATATWKAI